MSSASMRAQSQVASKVAQSPTPCGFCGGKIICRSNISPARVDRRKFCTQQCRIEHQRKERSKKYRTCKDCKQTSLVANFSRYAAKNSPFKPYCKTCEPRHEYRKSRDAVYVADHVCKVCGDIIAGKGSPWQINKRVTCSEECNKKGRRRSHITCRFCQKTKEYEDFDKHGSKKRRLMPYCRECVSKNQDISHGDIRIRPHYNDLYTYVRYHCASKKRHMAITLTQVRRLWNTPCHLCGGLTGRLVHKDLSKPVTKDNVWPACRPCALLQKAYPGDIPDLTQQAVKIARHAASL